MLERLSLLLIFFNGVLCDFYPEYHPNWSLLPHDTCGQSFSVRIIGGDEAELGSLPWMTNIGYKVGSRRSYFGCGGALISEDTVITAAHCVTNLGGKVKLTHVRLGEHDLSSKKDCVNGFCSDPPLDIEIDSFIYPTEYAKETNRDIALLKLRDRVQFSDFVKPICLPRGEVYLKDFEGSNAEVAGWGVSDLMRSASSTVLQVITLPILSKDACKKLLPASVKLRPSQFCAGGLEGKDSCDGDSGGPLMKLEETSEGPAYFIIGLVSFGPKNCGSYNKPAIYTKISYYMKWILDNINGEPLIDAVQQFV